MKPTKNLISALYSAADRIENDVSYCWKEPHQCNCGLLVQELLNINGEELKKRMAYHNWTWMARHSELNLNDVCPTTNIPYRQIIEVLSEYGLEAKDYEKLEFGNNYDMVDRSYCRGFGSGTRKSMAATFRKYARELEEQRKIEQAAKFQLTAE